MLFTILCRVRRLDAPLRRRRHRTQARTKQIKKHKRNNKIFSDACASKGRRGRRPLQGRCVQCNHTDNARAQRKHSSHFLKFSAIHCRVRRLDAPLRRRRHRTQARTKQIKKHKRNNKIFSDACASKGRRGRRPLQGRCVQCNHTDNARAQRKHSSHFLKFSAIHCRVRRLDAPLPPSAAQNASSEQSKLNSMNIASAHSAPNFRLSNP